MEIEKEKALKLKLLHSQLDEMEHYITYRAHCNSAVSSATVGWHLSHSLKVINHIINTLELSKPKDYKKEFSFMRSYIFLTRKIPRGKARSPKVVIPPEEITMKHLNTEITKANQNVLLLHDFPVKAHFRHPYFKHLNRNQTKTFLEIHSEHHLRIIREILK